MSTLDPLETERLLIKPFEKSLISERYISWLNDPEVVRFSEQRHFAHDYEDCERFLNLLKMLLVFFQRL